jgi:hypothetical protein
MAITNLSGAINVYEADAAKLFSDAHASLAASGLAEDVKKRIQGQLAAAFSQLSTAEAMRSAQQGRVGYEQVVELMKTTSATASAICAQLNAFVVPPGTLSPTGPNLQEKLQIIKALTDALQALAQISPTPVWQKASPPGSATG